MDIERLNERIGAYLKALHQLERTVALPVDEFIRDAVIQRYDEKLADAVHAFIREQALQSFQELARETGPWRNVP